MVGWIDVAEREAQVGRWVESLEGLEVKVTGDFRRTMRMTQKELERQLRLRGAMVVGDVRRSTNLLIRADSDRWKYGDFGDREAELAMHRKRGGDGLVVDVSDLTALLDGRPAWAREPLAPPSDRPTDRSTERSSASEVPVVRSEPYSAPPDIPTATESASNPDWSRDEIVLALDLFVQAGSLGGNPLPGKTDDNVIALSDLMQRLPIHPPNRRSADFRNPTGVSLKLANFRAIDRAIAIERGFPDAEAMPKGMARFSTLDRAIFEEFDDRWESLRADAAAIESEAAVSPAPQPRPTVTSRPVEQARTETFAAPPTSGGIRTRREAQLVRQFSQWMTRRGWEVESQEYAVDGEARPLICDAYVPGLELLIEAKAQDDRTSIRLAIGQLMDYRRFLNDPQLAVLLPHVPAPDHQRLLRSVGIGWIWPDGERFRDSAARLLTRVSSG